MTPTPTLPDAGGGKGADADRLLPLKGEGKEGVDTSPKRQVDLADALSALVARVIPGATEASDVARLSGGASQETWSFRASGPGVDRALILRRQPAGLEMVGKIGLETEAALMQAAGKAGVPSPTVVHVLAPDEGLGAGFVMDHVEGETLARKILRDEIFAAVRPKLAFQCGEVLARIHTIAPDTLPDLPMVGARRELDDLHETYKADGQPRPVFELAFRWLRERAPDASTPKLVHGDFRNGNLIIGPDGIRAVLDWELAHLGDPMRDLGWVCTNAWRFGEIDKPVGGFGTREHLIAGYEAAGGGRVDPETLMYWETFGSLRWGVMCLSMRARASGKDRPLERSMIARRASENEIDLLRLLAPRGEG